MFGRLGIFPGVFSPLSNSGLLLNETTIAMALKTVGYSTGMLGKWCGRSPPLHLWPPPHASIPSSCCRHLGTQQFLPTAHGFDYYFGADMTQNECISNIRTPGSAAPPPGHSPFGPCPILNGSDETVKRQLSLARCNATGAFSAEGGAPADCSFQRQAC
jgi:arylsulfatase A-like enzyme